MYRGVSHLPLPLLPLLPLLALPMPLPLRIFWLKLSPCCSTWQRRRPGQDEEEADCGRRLTHATVARINRKLNDKYCADSGDC